jgi:predicted nuclease of predicted toxin-antitoxin system
MKIKIDENLGIGFAAALREGGFDVATVREEGLGGKDDEVVVEVCRAEQRCLVTLDMDFANVLRFPPSRFCGVVVLRLEEPVTKTKLAEAAKLVGKALRARDPNAKLWVIRGNQVREYEGDRGGE